MRTPIAAVLVALVGASASMSQTPPDAEADGGMTMQESHKALSVSCFNECWNYLDKAERSPEDVEDMILLAYASLWHWKQRSDCQPVNLSIGYWQVSRVHAVAGHYQMARLFGDRCLEVSQKESLPPFYVGYAYEALARAELLNADSGLATGYLTAAESQLDLITDKEERGLLEVDLTALRSLLPAR